MTLEVSLATGISALALVVTVVGATAKLVAAWGAAAHQLAELRETVGKFGPRMQALEAWRERIEGGDERERELTGAHRIGGRE